MKINSDNVKMKPDNIEMEQLIRDVLGNEGHTFEDDGAQLNEEESKLLSVLVEISKKVKSQEELLIKINNETFNYRLGDDLPTLVSDAIHHCIMECTKSDKIDYGKVALKVVIKKALPFMIEKKISPLITIIHETIRNLNSILNSLENSRQKLWSFDSIEPCVKLLNAAKEIAYKKICENAEQVDCNAIKTAAPLILVSK